jgi:hypothetical protein
MSLSLNQVLTLAGTLDDTPGFDTPRERFRRYLTENIADVAPLRALIEDGQRLVGEQPHRALQDGLVLLGRFLGFETTFGTYLRLPGGVQFEGQWRSRHRLNVVIELRGEQTTRVDPDEMTRALAALAANTIDEAPRIGLSVVTPLFAVRGRLDEEQLVATKTDRRVVSTRTLLWLAEAVSAGRMKHDEVVRLLASGQSLDLVVDLLQRLSSPDAGRARRADDDPPAESTVGPWPAEARRRVDDDPTLETNYWAATVERSEAASFEQFVRSAVVNRRVLGVAEDRTAPAVARPGDQVCFVLPGKGVIGQAEIAAPTDGGLHLVRDSDRFNRIYQVTAVSMYDMAIVPDLETQQTLAALQQRTGIPGPLLLPLTPHKFESLTAGTVAAAEGSAVSAAWPPAIDRASRSRA